MTSTTFRSGAGGVKTLFICAADRPVEMTRHLSNGRARRGDHPNVAATHRPRVAPRAEVCGGEATR
jgi:hypothetical protein